MMKIILKDVALAGVTYIRILLAFLSFVAYWQQSWMALTLSIFGFGVLTALISRVLNTPSSDDIRELTAALRDSLTPNVSA